MLEITAIGAIIMPSQSNTINTKTLLTTALVQNDHDNDPLKETLQTFNIITTVMYKRNYTYKIQ